MSEEIVFTIGLTSDDWKPGLSAWLCPAVDIPTAFIKTAYDPNGKLLAPDLFKIEKGPARVSWKGSGRPPTGVTLGLVLAEKLSPASEERFWKGIALIVPIITAFIGVWGGWLLKPAPATQPGPNPPAVTRNLYFRVDPNDLKDSGMPPAKITVNNQEINQAHPYKVESDITAVVDTTATYRAFVNNKTVVTNSVRKIDLLFGSLNALNAHVNGNICSGGSHGEPSVERPQMSKETTDISDVLRDVGSELGVLTK
jgi:hypothetical protein